MITDLCREFMHAQSLGTTEDKIQESGELGSLSGHNTVYVELSQERSSADLTGCTQQSVQCGSKKLLQLFHTDRDLIQRPR